MMSNIKHVVSFSGGMGSFAEAFEFGGCGCAI